MRTPTFPCFIPESMLAKEAEHIEGFAPEVAWVTMGGTKQLEERLAIRPSSESIICPIFAEWVQSYRDLPILINQWCSVVRWEERPRSFLRTREFLWQEGHTAHATAEEAEERALQMIDVYNDFYVNELAIPSVMGRKSDSERFAGALRTYTLESMMRGKKWALQSCTSHNLGDHFGKSFNIQFLAPSGEREYRLEHLMGPQLAGNRRDHHGAWRSERLADASPRRARAGGRRADLADGRGARAGLRGVHADRARAEGGGRARQGGPRRRAYARLEVQRVGTEGRARAHRGRPPRCGGGPGGARAAR